MKRSTLITRNIPITPSIHPNLLIPLVHRIPRSRPSTDQWDREMKAWWERWPGRLEYEIDQLREAGIECELDRAALDKGIAILNIRHHVGGREEHLQAVFPDFYPYTRFEVFARDLKLGHHQNPFQKNLCMIGRATSNWNTDDTVAAFLLERLPTVIKAGGATDPVEVKELEEHQGEPISAYYPYFPNSVVLVDSAWFIDPAVTGGFLQLGIDKAITSGFRSVVLAIMDRNRKRIVEASPELMNMYRHRIMGRWVRSKDPILETDANRLCEELAKIDRTLSPTFQTLNTRSVAVIGVLFPEEVGWRRNRDGWMFVVFDNGSLPKK